MQHAARTRTHTHTHAHTCQHGTQAGRLACLVLLLLQCLLLLHPLNGGLGFVHIACARVPLRLAAISGFQDRFRLAPICLIQHMQCKRLLVSTLLRFIYSCNGYMCNVSGLQMLELTSRQTGKG